jgi:membrane-associated phospholipid phosphatase
MRTPEAQPGSLRVVVPRMAEHGARTDSPRLVTTGGRRTVVPAVALGVLVVGVLAVRVAGSSSAGPLDRALAALVPMHHGVRAAVGEAFAALGDPVPVVVLTLLAAAAAWWGRGGRGLALVLVAPPAAMVTTSLVLKPIVGRTRGGELAFPSGHTTAVASLAAVAAVLVLSAPALSRAWRAGVVGALALGVVAVGVSLVGTDVHDPSDVLGALGVVAAVVGPAALVVDAFADLATPEPTDRTADGGATRRLPALR